MIPKIIHYCWFGGKEIPDKMQKCILSWKKFLPDYEIKEWNEKNFNINCCDYVKEAYNAKKWAFVSDYARFWILYNFGGIYFDTDVEVIRNIDDIIKKGPFMGQELLTIEYRCYGKRKINVNPGLGIAAEVGNPFYRLVLKEYEKRHFIEKNGKLNETTIVEYVSDLLKNKGMKDSDNIQIVSGIYIYPVDYFCPMNYKTGKLNITKNTRTIHHYSATWKSPRERKFEKYIKILSSLCGEKIAYRIERIITLPFRIIRKVERFGFINTIKLIIKTERN